MPFFPPQWTSQRLSRRHSLDPILSHGSTLGLYEVLIGKPYICDMITDSVVHCIFIEAEKIDELRQSDPSVEVFLWQVSNTVHREVCITYIHNGTQSKYSYMEITGKRSGHCQAFASSDI